MHQVQPRVLVSLFCEALVYFQRLIVISNRDALVRVGREIIRVVRLRLKEQFRLLQGLGVFLAPIQDIHVIETRKAVVRLELQRTLENEFGIVEHAGFYAQVRQQAHAFYVLRILLQERPAQALGLEESLLAHHVANAEEFRWQRGEAPAILHNFGKQPLIVFFDGDIFERLPAREQGIVTSNGFFVCSLGCDSIAQRGFQVPLFLPGTAIGGAQLLQLAQCGASPFESPGVPQADSEHVQCVLMLGHLAQQVAQHEACVLGPVGRQQGLGRCNSFIRLRVIL